VRRNAQNSFGFSVANGLEDDLLPSIHLKPNTIIETYALRYPLSPLWHKSL
jgi:hypothetical protein